MKIFDRINNYINELDYKITITDNYVNIVNYINILDFNEKQISIRHSNGITIIEGKNLVVSKMLKDEILITGKIELIKLRK